MALPIKPTPILTGKDAKRFIKKMRENENKPVPREEYLRAQKTYEELKEKSIFLA